MSKEFRSSSPNQFRFGAFITGIGWWGLFYLLANLAALSVTFMSLVGVPETVVSVIQHLAFMTVFMLAVGIYYKLAYRGRWLRIVSWLKLDRLPVAVIGWTSMCLMLYYLSIGIIFLLMIIFGFQIPETPPDHLTDVFGDQQLLVIVLLVVFMVPIVEEILFRGWFYQILKTAGGVVAATLTSSLIFGLVHGWRINAIDTFLLAVFSCWLYEKTGSLWSVIILHAIKNSIAVVAGVLVS